MSREKLVLQKDIRNDCLMICGDTTGPRSEGEPCVTAATQTMWNNARWVYLPLEDAVEEIIDNKDDVPVDVMAERIMVAVKRGIARGRMIREKDKR